MSRFPLTTLLIVTLCYSPTLLPGQEQKEQPKIAPYLTDTAIGFAHVQIDRLDLASVKQIAQEYAAGLGDQAQQLETTISVVQELQSQFVEEGVTDLYVAMELENFSYGPYVLLEFKEGADVASITRMLQDVFRKTKPPHVEEEYKAFDGFLFAGDKEMLKTLVSGQVAERPQLAAALASVESDPLQIVLCPTPDQTRAIREAVPAFPAPYQTIDGNILARGIQFISLGGRLEPELGVRVVIQSADENAAEVLLNAEHEAIFLLAKLASAQFPIQGMDKLVDKLKMRRETDRLRLDFSFQPNELDQIRPLLIKPLEGMQEQTRVSQSINNLKQLGLAMHNWYDMYSVFPAHANYDTEGKPLLSWRVHVLPYLDQQELYSQFHLDEPWDSEHNKQFITRMPQIFAVPGSAVSKEGKTGYVFPILKDASGITTGTKDGIMFKEITDGTSNTALIVVADDQHSVIWTKPDDLVIDPEQPLAGLRFDSNGLFQTLFSDGSANRILKKIDPKMWLAVLTRGGGEVVELP